jgi:hypothetical protein
MATVIQVLGPHAHYLRRYGVNPEEDVSTASTSSTPRRRT